MAYIVVLNWTVSKGWLQEELGPRTKISTQFVLHSYNKTNEKL